MIKKVVIKGLCDDAISRQAVCDLMRSLTRWCVRSDDEKFNNVGLLYDDVMFGIDKLPPVKPQEPKTGRWLDWTDDRKDYLKCSICGYGEEGEVEFGKYTPYCPMCGAKMIEP